MDPSSSSPAIYASSSSGGGGGGNNSNINSNNNNNSSSSSSSSNINSVSSSNSTSSNSNSNNNNNNNGSLLSLDDITYMISEYKAFDLDGRRLSLNKTLEELQDMKKESVARKKILIDHTKAFKLKDKEGQIVALESHMKEYQEEIDQIGKRAKFSEDAFKNLFKLLSDIPSIVPVLNQLMTSAQSISSYELECIKLKNEISQYEEEFQSLKNQDITIRRLEDEIIGLRDNLEVKIQSELEERAKFIEHESNEKIAQIKEMQKATEKKYNAALEKVKLVQEAAERTQSDVFEISTRSESRINALLAENTVLVENLQREMSKNSHMQLQLQRNLDGKASNENGNNNNNNNNSNKQSTKDDADAFRESLLELRKEMARREDAWRAEKNKIESQMRDLSFQLGKEKENNVILKQANDIKSSKDVVQKLIRRIQFLQKLAHRSTTSVSGPAPSSDNNDDSICYNLFEGVTNGDLLGFNTSSENLFLPTFDINEELMELDRKMSKELPFEITFLNHYSSMKKELHENRRLVNDFDGNEQKLNAEIASLRIALESSSNLISKLENDLELYSTKTSGMDTGHSKLNASALGLGSMSDNISRSGQSIGAAELSQLLHFDSSSSSSSKSLSLEDLSSLHSSGSNVTSNSSTNNYNKTATTTSTSSVASLQQMVSILTSQRDRYKARIVMLEDNVQKLTSQVDALSLSKSQLEADNGTLYTKLRYFQASGASGGYSIKGGMNSNNNHSNSNSNSSSIMSSNLFNSPPAKSGVSDSFSWLTTPDQPKNMNSLQDIENKYGNLYENSLINPFSQFSTNEKQRKLDEMTVPDRIVMTATLAFVSSSNGRTFVLVYISLMHLLVFFTLYYVAHSHHDCV